MKEGLQNWSGAVQDYTTAIDALRPKDGRDDIALTGNARMQDTWRLFCSGVRQIVNWLSMPFAVQVLRCSEVGGVWRLGQTIR